MLAVDYIVQVVSEVECKDFQFLTRCVLCVRAGSLEIKEGLHEGHDHVIYIQASMFRTDIDTGETGWGTGAKYFVSPHMTTGEIVKRCFVAARDYAEHEVREHFQWQGRRVLGPHVNIYSLWDVADRLEVRS